MMPTTAGTSQTQPLQARAVLVRPSRTLSRKDSQREARLNPQVFVERWHTGPLADAPTKRLLGVGPKLFTPEHEDLLRRMRMEGARISQGMAEAQREATIHHERHTQTWHKLHKVRAELKTANEALEACNLELKAAHDILADVDAAYVQAQAHRNSRVMANHDAKGKETASDAPERCATPDLFPLPVRFAQADETI